MGFHSPTSIFPSKKHNLSKLYLGICSQAPQAEECISTFEELSLTTDNVDDFRMGE